MKHILTLTMFCLCFSTNLFAQSPYTQVQFSVDSIIDVNYGDAINYAGEEEALFLDIYKPQGDPNCLRPVMILAHGGAWVTDSKDNASMKFMSMELAKRGWVVANIDYRLGMNNTDEYETTDLCLSVTAPCAFISDSMEVERANFRAMQDAKGVVRFMKSRHLMDSTDINNVYMAGESAGGFIALSAGFTNVESKKPASCYAIGDAPIPDADFLDVGCTVATNDLSRPDLGTIEGDLHTGTYDASLQGVGSFFGGVIDVSIFDNVPNAPSVYLFAQGADVVIDFDYGMMFDRISNECLTGLCQGFGPYPHAYGGEGLRKYFEDLGTAAPPSQAEILDNASGFGDCLGNGHAIDDPELRLQNIADFFAARILASGNDPASNCAGPPDCLGDIGGSNIIGSPCNDNDDNTGDDTWDNDCNCVGLLIDCMGVAGGNAVIDNCGVCEGDNSSCGIANLKIYLEGAVSTGNNLMNTDLGNNNLIPNNQPYNTAPWNYNGMENYQTIPTNAVDWLLVQAIDINNNSIIETRAVLLLADGSLEDTDGTIGLVFSDIVYGNDYYLYIRHRNHLAIQSATPLTITDGTTVFDFTNPTNVMGNTEQVVLLDTNTYGLHAGDINGDGTINVMDFNAYIFALSGGSNNQYRLADTDLNGIIDITDFDTYRPNCRKIGIDNIRY